MCPRGKLRIACYSLGNSLFSDSCDTEADHRRRWALPARIGRDGVRTWRTLRVELDADGVPHPAFDTSSPWPRRRRRGPLLQEAP